MVEGNVTIGGVGAGTRIVGPLLPHRDDAVATWLKAQRDEREGPQGRLQYAAIDALLDEYRLRADLGLELDEEIPGEAML